MGWRVIGFIIAFPALTFAQEKTMTMTWDHAERADGYVVKRGGCEGEEVHRGPANQYIETITQDVTYCVYAYNDFGDSDTVVKTAWYEATRPGKITVTITVEVQ